jgi:hypothetical protein
MVMRLRFVVLAILAVAPFAATGYQLSPTGTKREVRLERLNVSLLASGQVLAYKGAPLFLSPVHEEITARIWGCENVGCDEIDDNDVPTAVLAGVRWNDDPRFLLAPEQAQGTTCKFGQSIRVATQPICWAQLFRQAERGAARGEKYGPGDPLLHRTHFGDLQFLHAMASAPGEPAGETRRKMLGWAEFAWRVSAREFTIDTDLKDIPIPVIQERFGTTTWRVQDLLTLGNKGIRADVDDVAFGTLLHMLEDSYAAGHVDRRESSGTQVCRSGNEQAVAPGAIVEFHAYNDQDHDAHSKADSREAFLKQIEEDGDVVEVGRALKRYYDTRANWDVVKPYLECAFAVLDENRAASAGAGFSK